MHVWFRFRAYTYVCYIGKKKKKTPAVLRGAHGVRAQHAPPAQGVKNVIAWSPTYI